MAVGVITFKTVGRLIFDLQRGEEETSRSIEIPYPLTDGTSSDLQNAVNTANGIYASSVNGMNLLVQPANWRDTNLTEEQWTTTGVHYEIVETTTTPVMPAPVTLGSAQESEVQQEHQQEHQQEQQG